MNVAWARVVQADAVKFVPNTAEDALYVHTDHLGAPRKLSDASGAVVWDASLTPFGIEDSIAGTETLNSRFPGQRYDPETALHYNYFRDGACPPAGEAGPGGPDPRPLPPVRPDWIDGRA